MLGLEKCAFHECLLVRCIPAATTRNLYESRSPVRLTSQGNTTSAASGWSMTKTRAIRDRPR
ncbi:hypothetical protein NY08_1275 [Rhodococcus sp. B7740]|nr:hypothetical protein NY08_1275 [Rhodococcus sp. B7740]